MDENHSLNDLHKKAHEINCDLTEADYDPREIEIVGYYLKRIAASYLSFHTHRELAEAGEISFKKRYGRNKEKEYV
jgi:hypothetical protein